MANIIDDNENKGGKGRIRRQGRRATRKMNRQAKDDLKYMPVDDHATPKQQSARKLPPPPQRAPQPLVKRFVGSTPNIGKNNAMDAMVKGVVKAGLSAATVTKAVKATRAKAPSFTPSDRTMELGSAHDEPAVGKMVKTALSTGPSPIIHHKKGGGMKKPPVRTKKVKKVRTPRRYK